MKPKHSKIVLIILIKGLLMSCSAIKQVGSEEHLITKNTITVNEKVEKSEDLNNLLYQQTNSKVFGIPLRLYIFNLARPNIDSILKEKIYNNSEKLARKTWKLSRNCLLYTSPSPRDA